jgi:hypothetical protein
MRESNPSEPATISVLLGGFQHKKGETQDLEEERSELDPWSLYIYAMNVNGINSILIDGSKLLFIQWRLLGYA